MQEKETNNLFPVFLKLETMSVLIVGGGKVGLEKLSAILQHAPRTNIRLVATSIADDIKLLALAYPDVQLFERLFLPDDVTGSDMVIVAINDPMESVRISDLAKQKTKLVNVADKPELCDFYMSSIVQKGNLKIAISTNGKSPTIGKRLKELFNEMLPDELDDILSQMHIIRSGLQGDFAEKLDRLRLITRDLAARTVEESDQAN